MSTKSIPSRVLEHGYRHSARPAPRSAAISQVQVPARPRLSAQSNEAEQLLADTKRLLERVQGLAQTTPSPASKLLKSARPQIAELPEIESQIIGAAPAAYVNWNSL